MLRTRDEGASLYRPPPRPLRRSSSYDISSQEHISSGRAAPGKATGVARAGRRLARRHAHRTRGRIGPGDDPGVLRGGAGGRGARRPVRAAVVAAAAAGLARAPDRPGRDVDLPGRGDRRGGRLVLPHSARAREPRPGLRVPHRAPGVAAPRDRRPRCCGTPPSGPRAAGRSVLGSGAFQGSAGAAFAARVGATAGLVEARRVQALGKIPAGRVAFLREQAAQAAAGYSLVRWDGRTPEEYLARYAEVENAMADAPHDVGEEHAVWDAQPGPGADRRRPRAGGQATLHGGGAARRQRRDGGGHRGRAPTRTIPSGDTSCSPR